jgi:hypothetical protein
MWRLINESYRYRYPTKYKRSIRSKVKTFVNRWYSRFYERHKQFIWFGRLRPSYTYNPYDPIHGFFSLSYASYLVLPRAVLQDAPPKWQEKFVRTLEELNHIVDYDDSSYTVQKRDDKGRFVEDPLAQYRHPKRELITWKNLPTQKQ